MTGVKQKLTGPVEGGVAAGDIVNEAPGTAIHVAFRANHGGFQGVVNAPLYIHAPVTNLVGATEEPKNVSELTHEEWLKEHAQDQEFIRATRIAATRPERMLLQKLICLGARPEHVREVWGMRLLKEDDGTLTLSRPQWLVWAGLTVFLSLFALNLPFAAQAYLLPGHSLIWLIPFSLFTVGMVYAVRCGRGFIYPWRLAKRLRPLVDELNRQLLAETKRS